MKRRQKLREIIFSIILMVEISSAAADLRPPPGVFPDDYNKYEAPSKIGRPAHVYVDLSVMDVDRIDEDIMEFSIQSYLIERWYDARLNLSVYIHNNEINTMFPLVLAEDLWKPDLVFDNAKSGVLFSLSIPNTHIRVSQDGSLYRSTRYNLVIGCQMNFHYYPMDTQECFLKIALLSNPDHKVILHWADEADAPQRKPQSILFTNNIQPLKYHLLPPRPYKTVELWPSGNYTYLYANFTFVRRISSSLLNVYVPSTLVVFLSWISFWLDVGAVPARITLGVTSLLTLATQVVQARGGLPPISYMTAMDMWLFVCLLTVFSSILEYAFSYQIHVLNTKQVQLNKETEGIRTHDHKEELRFRKTPKVVLAASCSKPPSSRKSAFEFERVNKTCGGFVFTDRTLDAYCRRLFPLFFAIFALIYWSYYMWLK